MTGLPAEGSSVSYVGTPRPGVAIGDVGTLLTTAGRGAHVKWASGVSLEDVDDLVPASSRRVTAARGDGLEDSLEVGAPADMGLAHLCALRGPRAVLSAITATRPQDLAEVVTDVRTYAQQRVAAAPTIQRVTAQLDEEEGAELVRLTAVALLQETFGVSDG